MLAIIVLLVMITTCLFAWAVFNTALGMFGMTKSNSALSRLQNQFNQERVNIVEKDLDAEDEAFTRLKISITSFIKRFLRFPIVTNILLTPSNLKKTEEKLIWAGRPFGFTADQWISVNIFLTLIIGLYAFFMYTMDYINILLLVLYIGGTLILPSWWLRNRIKARSDKLEQEIPNVINKLVLATMSSAQILTALNIVVKHTSGILTDEIRQTLSLIRINAGELTAEQAFWDMAQRCGNPQVTSFCTSIINSIMVKSSVSVILQEQAINMKEVRKAHNEEIINRTDTLLMLSALLGVLSIIILSAGPGFILILQGMGA